MTRAYLDHASTTPVRPAALEAVADTLRLGAADPSRVHHEGGLARQHLEDARDRVADFLGARSREVIFTSGASESIAAVSFGAQRRGHHTVVAPVEHSAVTTWADRGPTTDATVDRLGRIDAESVGAAITEATGIVHCQWSNHEVATTQPLEQVAAAVDGRCLLHTDAAAAIGHVSFDFATCPADVVSVSGHKLGAPAGIGVLLVRRGLRLDPLITGGDQERARRAGMESVALAAGLAAACTELASTMSAETDHQRALTQRVIDWADGAAGVAVLGDPVDRSPHIVCLGIDDLEPQPVLMGLDQRGVAVHSGSSCSSEALEPSPVLAAMGADASRSLRISVGWSSTTDDIDRLLTGLPEIIEQLRRLRS